MLDLNEVTARFQHFIRFTPRNFLPTLRQGARATAPRTASATVGNVTCCGCLLPNRGRRQDSLPPRHKASLNSKPATSAAKGHQRQARDRQTSAANRNGSQTTDGNARRNGSRKHQQSQPQPTGDRRKTRQHSATKPATNHAARQTEHTNQTPRTNDRNTNDGRPATSTGNGKRPAETESGRTRHDDGQPKRQTTRQTPPTDRTNTTARDDRRRAICPVDVRKAAVNAPCPQGPRSGGLDSPPKRRRIMKAPVASLRTSSAPAVRPFRAKQVAQTKRRTDRGGEASGFVVTSPVTGGLSVSVVSALRSCGGEALTYRARRPLSSVFYLRHKP